VLRRLRTVTGDRLALISVGGVESADDVWERLRAGATLVQAYTGFIYGGPGWPGRINRELARRLEQGGHTSIQEVVGAAGAAPDTGARLAS
jgi:dihydroorotate dehydrogenase